MATSQIQQRIDANPKLNRSLFKNTRNLSFIFFTFVLKLVTLAIPEFAAAATYDLPTKSRACFELKRGYRSAEEVLAAFPDQFTQEAPNLIMTKASKTVMEFDAAMKISRTLPEGASLTLTTYLFGKEPIPTVDGTIYWGDGRASNISIKTVQLKESKVEHGGIADRVSELAADTRSSIRKHHNYPGFIKKMSAETLPDGTIRILNHKYQDDDRIRNIGHIADLLGYRDSRTRKAIIAISIHDFGDRKAQFRLHTRGRKMELAVAEGESLGHKSIDLHAMIANLRTDNEIEGYILIAASSVIYIDQNGFSYKPIDQLLNHP